MRYYYEFTSCCSHSTPSLVVEYCTCVFPVTHCVYLHFLILKTLKILNTVCELTELLSCCGLSSSCCLTSLHAGVCVRTSVAVVIRITGHQSSSMKVRGENKTLSPQPVHHSSDLKHTKDEGWVPEVEWGLKSSSSKFHLYLLRELLTADNGDFSKQKNPVGSHFSDESLQRLNTPQRLPSMRQGGLHVAWGQTLLPLTAACWVHCSELIIVIEGDTEWMNMLIHADRFSSQHMIIKYSVLLNASCN